MQQHPQDVEQCTLETVEQNRGFSRDPTLLPPGPGWDEHHSVVFF
jgi:hypothetical protein